MGVLKARIRRREAGDADTRRAPSRSDFIALPPVCLDRFIAVCSRRSIRVDLHSPR